MGTELNMDVSYKLARLMMLLLWTRVNTLTCLKVTNIFITEKECSLTFDEVLRHTRPNYCQNYLSFEHF